jgi:hypothetical protein
MNPVSDEAFGRAKHHGFPEPRYFRQRWMSRTRKLLIPALKSKRGSIRFVRVRRGAPLRDGEFICVGAELWTTIHGVFVSEQQFFAQCGLALTRRCQPCRDRRRAEVDADRVSRSRDWPLTNHSRWVAVTARAPSTFGDGPDAPRRYRGRRRFPRMHLRDRTARGTAQGHGTKWNSNETCNMWSRGI